MSFSYKDRKASIEFLKNESVDLLIIGGGITGAGVALQAAAAGIKTALIEMQDFAEGTSSRSTKLVHGGIRYLKTFDVEVVADTVGERAVIQRIAPHIPKPDPMILPIYDEPGSTFSMFSVKIAMELYDQLAKVTGTKYEHYTISADEVLKREPQLRSENLLGAGVYLDYDNNDARLTIENIKQAHKDGAHLLSKTEVLEITHNEEDKVNGVKVKDLLTAEEYTVQAKIVINTAGPWSDIVRHLDSQSEAASYLRPTKGVHLVVDREKLNVPQPTYFDTGKNDGRMIFVIPRENKTYFGTTDTDYKEDFKHPTVTKEDVDYLLEVVNYRYPQAKLTVHDIESSWAGLRPLIASSGTDYNGNDSGNISDKSFNLVVAAVQEYLKDDSRRPDVEKAIKSVEDDLQADASNPSAVSRGSNLEEAEDGLITLSGGKLTDYRLMAESALQMIQEILKERFGIECKPIDSSKYPVSGGSLGHEHVEEEMERLAKMGETIGLSKDDALYLANLYGSNMLKVISYDQKEYAGLAKRDSISLRYAMEEEMALTPVDYLLRRTNHILFMRDTLDAIKEPVIQAMADFYHWDDEITEYNRKELQKVIDESDLKTLKEPPIVN